jgi:CO/xanthine dehydrogenase Mo-binding subunit
MTLAVPRGFTVDRNDGRPVLPGNLHTNRQLSQWLDFSQPGRLRLFTGKVELGQGILTALSIIAADELDLSLNQVHIVSASTLEGPDEGMTSSSISVQDSGSAIRHACAEVRFLALQEAAKHHGVPAENVCIKQGRFTDTQGRNLGDYWDWLKNISLHREYEGLAKPKPVAELKLHGHGKVRRIDLFEKIMGQPRFIHDLRLPDMRHGRVLRAPSVTAQLVNPDQPVPANVFDTGSGSSTHLIVDGRFIGVVAATEMEADAALSQLQEQVAWRESASLPDMHNLADFLRNAPHETTHTLQKGQILEANDDEVSLSREYFKPYIAHASIGLCCALAQWNGQTLQVWTHSQGIQNLRDDLTKALGLDKQSIVMRHVEGAGCYGHNGADDVAFDAALLAMHQPGHPVRVVWSRADELSQAPLGSAHLVSLRARLNEHGQISHWHHELWANGYSSRPGRSLIPTLLGASQCAKGQPMPLAINPPLAAGGGSDRNAIPGYSFDNTHVVNHRLTVMPIRTSAMRALGAFANVFAIESFMDELAHASGQDPLKFRKLHMQDPRSLAVLNAVVDRSTWWHLPKAEGVGHGVAWARYKNTSAWCAVLARVQAGETLRVLQLDVAVDVGRVVDLDGVINQTEGGALQGMSWALKEAVQFDRTRITTQSWADYPILRFSEVPELKIHVLDQPEQPSLGAGESVQGPVAAALSNALFDALEVRVRNLPLSQDHILQALNALN